MGDERRALRRHAQGAETEVDSTMAGMNSEASLAQAIQADSAGVLYDLEPESKRLIVAFGGLAGKLGLPPFEFFRTLSSGPKVKTAFVRDHAQAWYHRGVPGIGKGIDPVAAHIIDLRAQAEEVVTIGTSAGGYAALLFGALADCEAHAFSPQTFLAPVLREEHDDRRWELELKALGADLDPRYADLLPVLAAGTAPAHLYYGSGNRLDRIHAERLGRLPQVMLHPFDTEQHTLIHDLRSNGWLKRFLAGLAQGAETEVGSTMAGMNSEASLAQAIQADSAGVLYDLEPESKRLIVAFGGLAGRLGMPPFEFFRTLSSGAKVKTAFVRDHAQAWYHRGVPGIGKGIDPVAAHIIDLRAQAEEVVTIGTAAGGYAALLFGALADCEAHAFSPQTFLAPGLREEHDDRRCEPQLTALGADLDPRYADLLPVLAAGTAPAHLYYGSGNRLNRIHAERLGRLPQVTLHPFDTKQQNLMRYLRSKGRLKGFLAGLGQGAL